MLILLATLARAQDDEPDGTMTTGVPELGEVETRASTTPDAQVGDEWPARVYWGADALGLEVEFIGQAHAGCQLLYKRRYGPAKKHFNQMSDDWPGRGIGNVGLVLVYQGLMMENFDFGWEKSYLKANKAAQEELALAVETPGAEGWEHFMLGMLMGVESIHTMRKEEYLSAMFKGIEAMDHIEQVKVHAPDFRDVLLADGLYKYWRSAITLSTRALPDFGDKRAEGIADLQQAEAEATFLGPAATLALSFTWIEEKKLSKALDSAERNHKAYPDNVINNLIYGRVLLQQKRFREADNIFQQVLEDDENNKRAHYYLATSYVGQDRLDEAMSHIDTYLGFDLDDYYTAQAYHRKADVYWKREDYANAEIWYRKAVKTDGYKASKKRLARIKDMKKKGLI